MRPPFPKGRYKRHASMSSFVCWYCGDFGSTEDHFPPVSLQAAVPDIKGWSVRCCQSCNSILGDSMQLDLSWRKRKMLQYLERKVLAQVLMIDGYTREEISQRTEFSLETLRRFNRDMRTVIIKRYKWMEELP